MKCVAICGHCHGTSCLNSNVIIEMEENNLLDRDLVENDSPPDEPADENTSSDATPSGSHEF